MHSTSGNLGLLRQVTRVWALWDGRGVEVGGWVRSSKCDQLFLIPLRTFPENVSELCCSQTDFHLADLLQPYAPSRPPRSAAPKTNRKLREDQVFSVAAPTLWNALPLQIRQTDPLLVLKSSLKTYFFPMAFNPDRRVGFYVPNQSFSTILILNFCWFLRYLWLFVYSTMINCFVFKVWIGQTGKKTLPPGGHN